MFLLAGFFEVLKFRLIDWLGRQVSDVVNICVKVSFSSSNFFISQLIYCILTYSQTCSIMTLTFR